MQLSPSVPPRYRPRRAAALQSVAACAMQQQAMEQQDAFVVQGPDGRSSVQVHQPRRLSRSGPSADVARDHADRLIGDRPVALTLVPLELWNQFRRSYSVRFARLPSDHAQYSEAATIEFVLFHPAEQQTHNCGLYSMDYRTDGAFLVTPPLDWSGYTEDGQVPQLRPGIPHAYFRRPI